MDKWTHFRNFVGDDLWIVKQMSFWRIGDWTWQTFCYMPITDSISQLIYGESIVFGGLCLCHSVIALSRWRTTLKFWSATMFGAAARNFGPVHKFELPTVIADSVPRATRVFSLASVGHVTGHMVSYMVPNARCRPPYWKIFTVNNLATVF